MYIFSNVVARVDGPQRTIEILPNCNLDVSRYPHLEELGMVGDVFPPYNYWMEFKHAKSVAYPLWLSNQLKKIDEVGRNGGSDVVPLTYIGDDSFSFLRGFNGGLFLVTENYLIVPQRGLDAPSSPGLLDGNFGRTTSKDEYDLSQLVFAEGFEEEVVLTGNGNILVPELLGSYRGYNSKIRRRLLTSARNCGVQYDGERVLKVNIVLPHRPYRIIIHQDNFPKITYIDAGLASLPHLSSIEPYAYAFLDMGTEEDGLTLYDAEHFLKDSEPVAVNRNIFRVNRHTGHTIVWNRGKIVMNGSIKEILGQTAVVMRDKLGDKFDENLVSPKLRTALEGWPTKELGSIEGLRVLYE